VWHPALTSKCRALGLGNYLTSWISNFLSNRSIQVLVDGHVSIAYLIHAGVPQGCVLSPTLFIIFINDLLSLTDNPVFSYADDSTLISSYKFMKKALSSSHAVASNRALMTTSINTDLAKIDEWGKRNRVHFNASKTQCCLFSRKLDAPDTDLGIRFQNENIEQSQNLDILGTRLTMKLLWGDHVFKIAKNAAKCLGFLWRCRLFFTPADLLKIYKSFIRPKMESNSHIWSGAPPTILNYLDKVQARAIRLIDDNNITASLAPLGHRRNIGALSLLYKYFVGNDTCSNEIKSILPILKTFSRLTRQAATNHPYFLAIHLSSTEYYENSFIVRTSKLWNLLPHNVFPQVDGTYVYNLQEFKSNINKLTLNLSAHPSLIPFFPSP